MVQVLQVIDDVGGGAREVISDPNGLFGSRYFLSGLNERTSFARRPSPSGMAVQRDIMSIVKRGLSLPRKLKSRKI